MSEMYEGIQMAMISGQAMAFTIEKGAELTREILTALAKLIKVSALYLAPKIRNAYKQQPGAVSMNEIRNRVPIRINEADQKKFFDWMYKAKIEYCPLQDLNPNDKFSEFIIDERDLGRLQSIVDRNQKEFSMDDFKIITWEDYAMNHIDEEQLEKIAKEVGIDLDEAVNQTYDKAKKRVAPSKEERKNMKDQIFRDDFAKGEAVAITANVSLINQKLSNDRQMTFRIPGEKDKYVSIPKEDLLETDGGKTFLGRLEKKGEYTVIDTKNKIVIKEKGGEIKARFDDVHRERFVKREQKLNKAR